MVSAAIADSALGRIWDVLDRVMDPEIPVISVVDLGIVREVRDSGDGFEIVITPTYSGCPATRQIEQDISAALADAGIAARLSIVLSPAWTTDWISKAGREKLEGFGIAPPVGKAGKRAMFGAEPQVACPQCGSVETEMISEFGSTPCKALWRCTQCREPFDYFKCL
ncbi:MAG TPA: 1,2-phenylacetyl-CoA epoxidase subunit PaaD [Aestuariivirgaceae bacterium]|nr:1,2-phenylacetyl-CoA epoxidase subunit PaaD [Aestuariivirgaceae bacterium]